MKLPAITRPNGKIYRPRTLTSRMLGDEDETVGVVVFGTHEIAEATSIARLDVRAMNREIGFHDDEEQYVVDEGSARLVWWRQDLAHFDEYNQARYYHTEDEVKGRAGVHFDLSSEVLGSSDPYYPDCQPVPHNPLDCRGDGPEDHDPAYSSDSSPTGRREKMSSEEEK